MSSPPLPLLSPVFWWWDQLRFSSGMWFNLCIFSAVAFFLKNWLRRLGWILSLKEVVELHQKGLYSKWLPLLPVMTTCERMHQFLFWGNESCRVLWKIPFLSLINQIWTLKILKSESLCAVLINVTKTQLFTPYSVWSGNQLSWIQKEEIILNMAIVNGVSLNYINFLIVIFHIKLICFLDMLLICPSGFESQCDSIWRLEGNSRGSSSQRLSREQYCPLGDIVEIREHVWFYNEECLMGGRQRF